MTSYFQNWSVSELSGFCVFLENDKLSGFCVFLENDKTDLCRFFQGLGENIYLLQPVLKNTAPGF